MQHQPRNTLVTLKEMQCKIGKENFIISTKPKLTRRCTRTLKSNQTNLIWSHLSFIKQTKKKTPPKKEQTVADSR